MRSAEWRPTKELRTVPWPKIGLGRNSRFIYFRESPAVAMPPLRILQRDKMQQLGAAGKIPASWIYQMQSKLRGTRILIQYDYNVSQSQYVQYHVINQNASKQNFTRIVGGPSRFIAEKKKNVTFRGFPGIKGSLFMARGRPSHHLREGRGRNKAEVLLWRVDHGGNRQAHWKLCQARYFTGKV